MDKIDKTLLQQLSEERRIDKKLVSVLGRDEGISAVVRVRNLLELGLIERRFKVQRLYPFIRSAGISLDLGDAIKLQRMQEVEYVSSASSVLALDDASDNGILPHEDRLGTENRVSSRISSPISQKNIGDILLLSDGKLDGRGVTLCVMDTGVSPHSDLSIPRERVLHFEDFINGDKNPYDDNGHGTFVAGVAAGNGMLSGGSIRGVAPAADIVAIKAISSDGVSSAFKILDGMQWLFDNFRQYGVRVACMSFGADPVSYADPLKMGVEMLSRSGLIVVAASGNSGEGNLKSPAISPEIISVGAVDDSGKVAPFTSRGTYMGISRPDVYASGVNVRGIAAGGAYSYMTGTSAAAPYVAGACCLLCQKYRRLSPADAKNMLLNSCSTSDGVRVLRLQ